MNNSKNNLRTIEAQIVPKLKNEPWPKLLVLIKNVCIYKVSVNKTLQYITTTTAAVRKRRQKGSWLSSFYLLL